MMTSYSGGSHQNVALAADTTLRLVGDESST
jgi:hypothetical protein